MPERYYDVVVLGRSEGALVAAALLARRDFTVLLFGQGQPPTDYPVGDRILRRRASTMLAATSPVWRRVLGELGKSQHFKRIEQPVAPMMQVLMPDRRLEVPPDTALFEREVQREFPEVRRLVAELYGDFARVTAAADAAFERDALWPPGTFLERRETGRMAATLPYARAEGHADLLAEFPRDHPYRRIVTESVRYATDLATSPPAFAVARLHGLWTRGPVSLPGGRQQLEDLLLDRIAANGGRHLMQETVVGLEVRRGAVAGVHVDGEPSPIGAGFVITDMTGEELAGLAAGVGITKRALREWPRISPTTGRFVVSIIARRAGLPAPLGREAFLLPARPADETAQPAIHLQRYASQRDDEDLLVAELLITEQARLAIKEVRAHVLERLVAELPFFERHVLLVDSVHDGLPPWRYEAGRRYEVDRTTMGSATGRAETMEPQLEVDPPGYLGLGGEPVRGPIDRTLLVGPSVLPALGQEGRLLAALGAARLVTRSDRRKARVRREMWTKIEIS